MAREFNGPLTEEDLEYLRARYTEAYVQRQVDLYGVADGAEEAASTPDEGADGDSGQTGGDDSGDGNDGSEEDLIGDADTAGNAVGTTYNPGDHTVDEVNAHLKTVSAEEREAILALERDGRNRSSIVG